MKLAVGFFDGVHCGHRRILANADVALTFRDHPARAFAPERAPQLLMTSEERLVALRRTVPRVVALDFTPELAAESADSFAERLKRDFPGLETVFCGPNWTFGRGGAGNADFLRLRGICAETIPFAMHDGLPVSSTRIRKSISFGNLPSATAMLGRPWQVSGRVILGKGLGRRIGAPTLNVEWSPGRIAPPFGVYAVDTRFGRAVANFGTAPTLGERAWHTPVLEVHLLEAPASLPDLPLLDVSFLQFIRPERKFATVDDLRRQISLDAASAASREI